MQSRDEAIHSCSDRLSGVASPAQVDTGFAYVGLVYRADFQKIAVPTDLVKRDGRQVTFDPLRIERAISRCFVALGRKPDTAIPELAVRVVNVLSAQGWPLT